MGPPASYRVSRVRYYSGATWVSSDFALREFHPLRSAFPKPFGYLPESLRWSATPKNKSFGLASFPFARRYLGNRCFFLLLGLLRCFSSPRFLLSAMCSLRIPVHYYRWVPPFGYPRIVGYLLLPAAFRSLSRPSSAPSAKASALCSSSLDLILYVIALGLSLSEIVVFSVRSF